MAQQMNNSKRSGISVDTEHIFPIIKKWLYSEKDIFLREIVSNAADAITKLKTIALSGEVETDNEYKITVTVDKPNKKLIITDNGIGMTAEELEKNLGTIARSGSLQFKNDMDKQDDIDIIGQFGVGFYSAFMVEK